MHVVDDQHELGAGGRVCKDVEDRFEQHVLTVLRARRGRAEPWQEPGELGPDTVGKVVGWMPVTMSKAFEIMPWARFCSPGSGKYTIR